MAVSSEVTLKRQVQRPWNMPGDGIYRFRLTGKTRCCAGIDQLQRVRIAVGELAAVEPDLLTFGWEAVIIDGPDAGAKLEIDFCKADQRCPQCDEAKDRSEGSWLRICPDCGAPLEVRGGEELDVLEGTFETDDDE